MAIQNKFSSNPLSTYSVRDFDAVVLRLAPPERIKEWSWGEVTKPETINYRTQRSEKNGLFDEKIFGPEKDYECYCGKYKGARYRGIVCEKCGVEITRAIVRRERMGHIELAAPIAHIWFLRGIPSRMALLANTKASDLEKVVYFAAFVVTSVDEGEKTKLLAELEQEYKTKRKSLESQEEKDKLKEAFTKTQNEIKSITLGSIIDDADYNRFSLRYGSIFNASIGAEAVYEIFKNLDLEGLEAQLVEEIDSTRSAVTKKKLVKRLKLVRSFIKTNTRPEWMFIKHLPVLPPALRPMVALDGGRHATSDVNDLYRRVINRNNRLKKLIAINAPHVILRNEKRILQEAVDALIDNSIRRSSGSFAAAGAQRRPLKSLADNLKGKQGIFRQNLLGKRVDYSGRSVIVVGPELSLDECGLPKTMALELFKPFVISKLIDLEMAHNIRGANRLIDEEAPEVWAILEEVIEGKYVLLNRAPTLHRLGIQAFKPRLVEGLAIKLHPCVCPAFNADFDGDQMAVHVPLSEAAQAEAREFMAADKNLLKPGSGEPITSPTNQDMPLGVFWLTESERESDSTGSKEDQLNVFPSPNYAITAHDYGHIGLRQVIKVLPTESEKYKDFNGEAFETTVGRLLFNASLPSDFPYINEAVTKKEIKRLVAKLIETYPAERIPTIIDKIKTLGFKYSTRGAITWGMDEIPTVEAKPKILDEAKDKVREVQSFYDQGLLSENERYQKIIQIWAEARSNVEEAVENSLTPGNSSYSMIKSGARGSIKQMTNMAGMKGLIVNNKGEQIEFPVLTGSKEGHTPIEYFITTHGSRKGLTDTALNTATAGYLTRKLFDVAQDVIITYSDQPHVEGSIILTEENLGGLVISLAQNITGRFAANDVVDEKGNKYVKKGEYISGKTAQEIEEAGIKEVEVYSPLTSKSSTKLSIQSYGRDLGTNSPVDIGEAVGTIAAQAIGEPGTQLTMRTFHAGGTASQGGDIVAGLPRVIEIFERRNPKSPAVIAEEDGEVTAIEENGYEKIIKVIGDEDARPKKKSKSKKRKTDGATISYRVLQYRTPIVKVGDTVKKGELLTDGSANLQELFQYAGKRATQDYIISQVRKIYELQGAAVSRTHLELITAQMFARVKITDPGDTEFTLGQVLDRDQFNEHNDEVESAEGQKAKAKDLILGISDVALSRESWLSSASFQHTNRILIDNAISGSEDKLRGLKENVIIGRLIPAGSGFEGSPKEKLITGIEQKALDDFEAQKAEFIQEEDTETIS